MRIRDFNSFKSLKEDIEYVDYSGSMKAVDWEEVNDHIAKIIKDYFYELVDGGFSIDVEQWVENHDIRYSVECELSTHHERGTEEWFEISAENAKKFYDASLMMKSQCDLEIYTMHMLGDVNRNQNGGENIKFSVVFKSDRVIS